MDKPFEKDGAFAANIRAEIPEDDSELRESMRKFGWASEFPALLDENGVVLVGHRRMAIAKSLGIEPVTKTIRFGKGDDADADRVRLAIISNIGAKPLTAKDRRHIAETLYGREEWTMPRIAKVLNVSARQVSTDLRGFEPASKPPRPKGGRPKGSGKRKPGEVQRQASINVTPEDWERFKATAEAEGISAAAKLGKLATAEPEIERAALSMSAQDKLDTALRQHKKKLDADYEHTVQNEVNRRLSDTVLPHYNEMYDRYKTVVAASNGVWPVATYNMIRRVLHPDNSASDRLRNDAFVAFEAKKDALVKPDVPSASPMPRTLADLMAKRAKVDAERRARRGGGVQRT